MDLEPCIRIGDMIGLRLCCVDPFHVAIVKDAEARMVRRLSYGAEDRWALASIRNQILRGRPDL